MQMQWSVVGVLWLVARMQFSVLDSQFSVYEDSETDGSHSTGGGSGVGDSGSGQFYKLNHQGHEGARRNAQRIAAFGVEENPSDYVEHVAHDFGHDGVDEVGDGGHHDEAGRH